MSDAYWDADRDYNRLADKVRRFEAQEQAKANYVERIADLERQLAERTAERDQEHKLAVLRTEEVIDLTARQAQTQVERDSARDDLKACAEALDTIPAILMLTVGTPYTLNFSEDALKQVASALSRPRVRALLEKGRPK